MLPTSDPSGTFPSPGQPTAPPVYVPPTSSPPETASAASRPSDRSDHGKASPPIDRSIVWNVPFDRVTMSQAVDEIQRLVGRGQPSYAITANLNYVMLHHQSESLRAVTEGASLILADGQPIVWRSRCGQRPLPERVAGSELIDHLACRAAQQGWRVYFLGARPPVALKCSQRLVDRYPGLRVAGVESPPFRPLTDQEQADQVQRIRDCGADLLLVAFGQPKGEHWIARHYQELGVPVSIQLGASFDFVAGTAQRAPQAWQRCGVEWAYRMLSDPRRLLPRYAANAAFLLRSLVGELAETLTPRRAPPSS